MRSSTRTSRASSTAPSIGWRDRSAGRTWTVAPPADDSGARPGGLSREQALITRVFARLSEPVPGAAGLVDDAAALTIPHGFDLVVTKDLVVAGVHFLPDDPPELVARKALRVNLSDLAAKGARPGAYFVGLALPD